MTQTRDNGWVGGREKVDGKGCHDKHVRDRLVIMGVGGGGEGITESTTIITEAILAF